MLKRLIPLSLAIAAATGCASSGRVHDKYYIRAASISGRERISLSLEFFDAEGAPLTAEGEDFAGALENAELKAGRPIFSGYTELVILGDCEYAETLTLLLNEWRVSPDCVVVYSAEGASLLRLSGAELAEGRTREAVKKGLAPESDVPKVLGDLFRNGEAEAPELTAEGVKGTKLLKK